MTDKLNTKPIVWIDCEMTGLDLKKDRLMEIACLVTDAQLNVIAEGPNLVIHQPDPLLESMNSWCTKTHTQVNKITNKISKIIASLILDRPASSLP